MRAACFALFAFVTPAAADVQAALTDHILPSFAQFSAAATALDVAAQTDCSPARLQPPFQTAFDAWMALADLRIGPSETGALSVAFWPDDRGFTPRALSAMIAAADPIGRDPMAYLDVSIAARGFFALEMLLYDPAFAQFAQGDYTCALVQTVASDLAAQATALDTAWARDFAPVLMTAGGAGNATYLAPEEAVRALYTQLLSSLDLTIDSRLGRPMGTFDRPRPRMAEAWRSKRSLRNVVLAVDAAHAMAKGLRGGQLPLTDAAVLRVHSAAKAITDPAFQDAEDPQARLRIEVLQQAVGALRDALTREIGDAMGISAGFNAQDGD